MNFNIKSVMWIFNKNLGRNILAIFQLALCLFVFNSFLVYSWNIDENYSYANQIKTPLIYCYSTTAQVFPDNLLNQVDKVNISEENIIINKQNVLANFTCGFLNEKITVPLVKGRWFLDEFVDGKIEIVVSENSALNVGENVKIGRNGNTYEAVVTGIIAEETSFFAPKGFNNMADSLFRMCEKNDFCSYNIIASSKVFSITNGGSIIFFDKNISRENLDYNLSVLKKAEFNCADIFTLLQNSKTDKNYMFQRLLTIVIFTFIVVITSVLIVSSISVKENSKLFAIYIQSGATKMRVGAIWIMYVFLMTILSFLLFILAQFVLMPMFSNVANGFGKNFYLNFILLMSIFVVCVAQGIVLLKHSVIKLKRGN